MDKLLCFKSFNWTKIMYPLMMLYNLLQFRILKKNPPTISAVVILIHKVLWTRLNSALQPYIVKKLHLKAVCQKKTETNSLQTAY